MITLAKFFKNSTGHGTQHFEKLHVEVSGFNGHSGACDSCCFANKQKNDKQIMFFRHHFQI